jgi:steroid delta-isomerase-like uncharacterized protein
VSSSDAEGIVTDVDNVALLRRYLHDVWDRGEPEAAERYLADDYVRHVSPASPPLGRREQVERLMGFRSAFPDIQLTLEDVIDGGDRVAFRTTMRGTHRGEFLGTPPTFRSVEVQLLDLWRIVDGRVVEQWGGPDTFDLLRQLRSD